MTAKEELARVKKAIAPLKSKGINLTIVGVNNLGENENENEKINRKALASFTEAMRAINAGKK